MEEELGSDGARRLNELMRREPAAREMYLDQVALHARLERELGGEVPELGAAGVSEKIRYAKYGLGWGRGLRIRR